MKHLTPNLRYELNLLTQVKSTFKSIHPNATPMNKPKLIPIALLIIALFIAHCTSVNTSTQTTEPRKIERPFKEVSVPNIKAEMMAQLGDTIRLDNGTNIYIQKNSFVDNEGNDVLGAVSIEYREFASAAEILVSGIPMKYDSAGITQDFQSAGMMEIRAYHAGEEVDLKPGKEIVVEMATYTEENDYKSYHFNEDQGHWVYRSSDRLIDNLYRDELFAKLEQEKPEIATYKPAAYDPSNYTFDLNINYHKFPELKDLNGVMWQYAGTDDKTDPSKNKSLKERKWSKISINRIKGNEGTFSLKLGDGKVKFNTVVKPVLRGKSLEAATEKFNASFASYQKKKAQIRQEKERLKQQTRLLRVFTVSQMGVYNYDRQLKLEDRIDLVANFEFGGDIHPDINSVTVFLITGDDKSVIKYPKSDWRLFAFSPNQKNKLIAVLPGDKVAVMSSAEFAKLKEEDFPKNKRTPHTFNLTSVKGSMASKEDLDKLIASL